MDDLLLELIECSSSEGIRAYETRAESFSLVMYRQLKRPRTDQYSVTCKKRGTTYLCTCCRLTSSLDTNGHEHIRLALDGSVWFRSRVDEGYEFVEHGLIWYPVSERSYRMRG